MIVKCQKEQKKILLQYIGENIHKCIYLYMNLSHYGCVSEEVDVYYSTGEDNELTAVFLVYFDCLHCFSKKEDICAEDLETMFSIVRPRVSYLSCRMVELLDDNTLNEYHVYHSTLLKAENVFCFAEVPDLELCTPKDAKDIAKFLLQDPNYYNYYSFDSLSMQIQDRLISGYSRSCVLRDNGRIVFHAGTVAEVGNVVMLGLMMLDSTLRGKGLGKKLFAKFCHEMQNSGYICYCYPADEKARITLQSIGFRGVDRIIKLAKNVE